jgi:hypothetical protein
VRIATLGAGAVVGSWFRLRSNDNQEYVPVVVKVTGVVDAQIEGRLGEDSDPEVVLQGGIDATNAFMVARFPQVRVTKTGAGSAEAWVEGSAVEVL